MHMNYQTTLPTIGKIYFDESLVTLKRPLWRIFELFAEIFNFRPIKSYEDQGSQSSDITHFVTFSMVFQKIYGS